MQTKTIEIYTFDELSDAAKEVAREWWRAGGLDYEWYDYTVGYAKELGALLGIDIDNIYFSGFWSQGDGASMSSTYHYRKGWRKALRGNVGGDDLLLLEGIGQRLQASQQRASYQITATTRQSGYYQSNMRVEVELGDPPGGDDWPTLAGCPHLWEDPVKEAMEDFIYWVYCALEKQYAWLNSDAQVDKALRANEYEFTAEGKVA